MPKSGDRPSFAPHKTDLLPEAKKIHPSDRIIFIEYSSGFDPVYRGNFTQITTVVNRRGELYRIPRYKL